MSDQRHNDGFIYYFLWKFGGYAGQTSGKHEDDLLVEYNYMEEGKRKHACQ